MRAHGDMRYSLVVSTSLHMAALLLIYFGLPTLFKPLPMPWRPVPIDIVDIGAITNTRVGKESEEMAKPAPPQPKPPVPAAETPKPPEPVKQPETKPPEPKPEERSEVVVPQPKVKPKPPEPEKKPTPADPLSSVLKNVAKMKPTPQAATAPDATPEKNPNQGQGAGPSLSDRLSISEEDALRRQISQCWNMPVGARDAQNLVVEVLIQVNPDRTVQSAEIVDQSRASSDPFFRAAAEAALRALRNPRCNPLELPPDKYEQWKTIHFNFDPRDML